MSHIRFLELELLALGVVLTLWFGTHAGVYAFLAGGLSVRCAVLVYGE